jgi:anti-sigma factor ChrR (cupin superfamily)
MSALTHQDEFLELVAGYALGALTQREAERLKEHISMGCKVCRGELESLLATSAVLASDAREVSPRPSLRAELMGRIAAENGHKPSIDRAATQADEFITIRADEGKWIKTSDKGVSFKPLFCDERTGLVTTLVRLEPGARIQMHRHKGPEQCLVIDGDINADNKTLGRGDFHVAMEGSIHQPLTTMNGALLLIVAPADYEVLQQVQ